MSNCATDCDGCGLCQPVISQTVSSVPSATTPVVYNPDTGNYEWTHTPGGGDPTVFEIPAFSCVESDGTLEDADGCVIPSGCLAIGPNPDGTYCPISQGAFF